MAALAEVVIDDGYPVTMNDPRALELMRSVAEDLAGSDAWRTHAAPRSWAARISPMSCAKIPGSMAFLGVAPKGSNAATNPPLPQYPHDHRGRGDGARRGDALRVSPNGFSDNGFD